MRVLPLSNDLVNRAERSKMALPAQDRTVQSGRRSVKFKTSFPPVLALVLYFECRPPEGTHP